MGGFPSQAAQTALNAVAADARITQAEMVALFGETMPIEAVTLLWDSPGTKTIGEIRAELRELARRRVAE